MLKDQLFRTTVSSGSFSFDEEVVTVFDDMIQRSVPLYHLCQEMISTCVQYYWQSHTALYDLGTSTGLTLEKILMANASDTLRTKKQTVVALDNSAAMLKKAQQRLQHFQNDYVIQYQKKDLNQFISFSNPSVVLINLVLQFLKPPSRQPLLDNIYKQLVPKGVLICIEKCKVKDPYQAIFEKIYFSYKKKQGYSDTEIKNKKLALKGVLQPLSLEENIYNIKEAGFKHCETFFQYGPFVGILAQKR